jgi:hypothetical protein
MAMQIGKIILLILSAVGHAMKGIMGQIGFNMNELSPLICKFDTLQEFTDLYKFSIDSLYRGLISNNYEDDKLKATNDTSTFVDGCFADLFNNFLSFNNKEDSEAASAIAEARNASLLIDEDLALLPAQSFSLKAFLCYDDLPSIHSGESIALKCNLALAGFQTCKASRLGLCKCCL